MALERVQKSLLAIVAVAVIAVLVLQMGLVEPPWTEDEGTVRVVDGDTGAELATVEVEVADTLNERHTGLSNHESLDDGEGMLFVHDDEDERTYVMREMDFDIDIVFVDADGEITAIEHARAPEPDEDGEDLQHSGEAKWVLEVPRGYANETGMEAGDEIEIEYE
ncbi:protein of unknown function DUF192 [Haloterrigena turkmenica DSM 5511]|uniref:DUF192 domain-containing protein n=1 Tax=Haloterrigena turkmenica (strain ATCC 51198 / DSM 5511 / JCM 9101 / NCIMB 13204 / VKM B-1734 / 4k) TaxID=543526 RepID=D2RVH6_HALTV|nr:DUF192 domain-containing protein [Haloterrigena turkmenica]ADB59340.1 protein of unknown function DUF192 [Haloterrigena turkmenica DSM 5511]